MRDRWLKAQEYELKFWKKHAPHLPDQGGPLPRDLDYVLDAGLDGKRVLEVGCGPMGAVFFSPGALRVGVDPLAAKYVAQLNFSTRAVALVTGMGEHLPLADDVFDVVICQNVLDHVEEPALTLAEIHRVLQPHGLVLMALHIIPRWLVPLRKILDVIDTGHPFHMTESEVYRLFQASNLEPQGGHTTSPRLGWRSWKAALANLTMRDLRATCRPVPRGMRSV